MSKGADRINNPTKAIRYNNVEFWIKRPVRLHSPRIHMPTQKANRPSQKKEIPLSSKRVSTKEMRHRIIPRAMSTMEKNRENPISENSCSRMAAEVPIKTG